MTSGNELRKQNKINQILAAATKLFFANGIKKTSIAEIAHEAGVSQVTLYKYFDSKERLGEDVAIKLINESFVQFDGAFADTTIPFPIQLRELLIADIKTSDSVNNDFFNFILEEMQGVRGNDRVNQAYNAGKDKFWGKLIQRGRTTGYLSDRVSDRAIMIYADMFVQYAQNANNSDAVNPSQMWRDMTNELVELFFFGMLKGDDATRNEVIGFLDK